MRLRVVQQVSGEAVDRDEEDVRWRRGVGGERRRGEDRNEEQKGNAAGHANRTPVRAGALRLNAGAGRGYQ